MPSIGKCFHYLLSLCCSPSVSQEALYEEAQKEREVLADVPEEFEDALLAVVLQLSPWNHLTFLLTQFRLLPFCLCNRP